MTDAQQVHPGWQALLDWLATHGMDISALSVQARKRPGLLSLIFNEYNDIDVRLKGAGYGLCTLRDCDPAVQLFSVPASALLNMATLSTLYPHARRHLTAIQLMSLHLFLYKPNGLLPSSDPIFGPYISTLPCDFASHPLAWLCSDKMENISSTLLSCLPANIMLALQGVANRFQADWTIIKQYIVGLQKCTDHLLL